jgi:hypothetical protein
MKEMLLITKKNNGKEVEAVIDNHHKDTKRLERLTMTRVLGM